MIFLHILLLAPVALLNLALGVELIAGLRKRPAPSFPDEPGRSLVIVPAHDEAAIIERSLHRLMGELRHGMDLLVVAHNCDDATAEIAEAAGVRVLRRDDKSRRGKGHALAFARDFLAGDPPDSVLIIDADCTIDGRSLVELSRAALVTGRPAQAVNLLRPDPLAHPLVQVSTFAFLLKNLVRQRGLQRISGGVHLTGTGMAFPWAVFRDSNLATSDVVEDLGLGLELSAAGRRPLFVSTAQVWSPPSTVAGTKRQRTRWEGGFLSTAGRMGLPLMLTSLARADFRRAWLGINLLIPPLALLALFNACAVAAALGLIWAGAAPAALWVFLLSVVPAFSAIVIAWARFGRAYMTPRAMLSLPAYLAWKLPMYLVLALRGPPRAWLRSGRET